MEFGQCSARRAESRGWSNSTLAADRIFIHSDTVRAALTRNSLPELKGEMAFIHQSGWAPPEGKALIKSHYTRSQEGIDRFKYIISVLASAFIQKYGVGT